MSINLIDPSCSTTCQLFGDAGPNGESPTITKVDGVPIAAAVEIQSTKGALVLPRMTTAEMNALTPVVPGMQVYVTDVVPGVYIRGSHTWNLVANSGDLDNVTVDQDDNKPEHCIPMWVGGGLPQLISTDLTVDGTNTLAGVSNIRSIEEPPDNLPIYGMGPLVGGINSEGVGTDSLGKMTLWAGGEVRAELNSSGQILSADGTVALPSHSFSTNPDSGMFTFLGGLHFATSGKRQFVINPIGNTVNYLNLSGGGPGLPVSLFLGGSDPNIDFRFGAQGSGNISLFIQNNPSFCGNVGIGITTFDADSRCNISIANGVAPTAETQDSIQIYSSDLTAGNTTLCLQTEGTNVSDVVDDVPTKNIAIKVNGTTYYLMAKTTE